MLRAGALISIGLLALAACQTPTPSAPAVTATTRPIVAATATVAPTSIPTSTSAPTATSTAEATATPTFTPEPTQAATPTPTPTTPAPTKSASPATREVFVNSDNVNFRDGPSTTGNVILVLAQSTALTAIDQPSAPDSGGIAWQNVRTADGRSGWVAAQFLSSTAPNMPTPSPTLIGTPIVTPIATPGYVYVASIDGLNLRADHSPSAQLIITLANGQRLQTNGLGFGPDTDGITWLNVKTDDDREGWVSAQFVNTIVPSVKPADPPTNENDIVTELLRRTNELRQQNGLPPYTLDTGLTALALAHSQYMAQNGITHIDGNGLSASKRITNAGYGGRPTENIYGGQASIDDAWDYWRTDPPHLQNLLNPVNTLIGIGVYKVGAAYYYTQDFAGPLK